MPSVAAEVHIHRPKNQSKESRLLIFILTDIPGKKVKSSL